MNIDLFIYQPKGIDFPNFRALMQRYGHLFNNKFLYISEHHTYNMFPDIDDWVSKEYVKLGFECIKPELEVNIEQDWFAVAIKSMLNHSKAENFLIMHQDFLTKDFTRVISLAYDELGFKADLVGYERKPNHIQPAFFACKRDIYERSNKNFTAGDGLDHCEKLSENILHNGGTIKALEHLGLDNKREYYHVTGVTQTYTYGLEGKSPLRERDYVYFYHCLKQNVPMNESYTSRTTKLVNFLKGMYPHIDPETHWLRRFLE